MSRTRVTGLLILGVAAAGCSITGPQPPTGPTEIAAQAVPEGDYWPLKAGGVWVMKPAGDYASKSIDAFEKYRIGTSTLSIEVTDSPSLAHAKTISRESVVCAAQVGADCPPYGDRAGAMVIHKDPSGMILLSPEASKSFRFFGSADGWRFIYPEGLRYLGMDPSTPKLPYLQIPRTIGEVSLATVSTAVSGYATYRFSEVRQSAAMEALVNVAAGQFRDCLKLTVSSTTDETLARPSEAAITSKVNLESIYWLAPGVGVVKRQTTYAPSYGSTPYVIEEELATYSVPL